MRSIDFAGAQCLSFRQLDEMNGLQKGSAFRLFKRHEQQLTEGQDFHYLPAGAHDVLIESLRAAGQVYSGTRHLVLITRDGYQKLQSLNGSTPSPSYTQ